jgi:HSP20 family protein
MGQHEKIETSGKGRQLATPSENYAIVGNLLEPLARLRGEFDRIFEEFPTSPFGANLTRRIQAFSGPALEFKDKGSEYELIAEVPGMKADDIDLKVSDGILRLSGERKDTREGEENGFMFSERHYGHFDRAIKLPDGVDLDKISASASDGVLTVCLPKNLTEASKEKRIPISVA